MASVRAGRAIKSSMFVVIAMGVGGIMQWLAVYSQVSCVEELS